MHHFYDMTFPRKGVERREARERRNFRISHRHDKTKFTIDEIVYLSILVFLSNCSDAEHMELGCCCKQHFSDKNLLTFAHLETFNMAEASIWSFWYLRRIKTANSFLGKQRTCERCFLCDFLCSIRRLVCSVIGHLLHPH